MNLIRGGKPYNREKWKLCLRKSHSLIQKGIFANKWIPPIKPNPEFQAPKPSSSLRNQPILSDYLEGFSDESVTSADIFRVDSSCNGQSDGCLRGNGTRNGRRPACSGNDDLADGNGDPYGHSSHHLRKRLKILQRQLLYKMQGLRYKQFGQIDSWLITW